MLQRRSRGMPSEVSVLALLCSLAGWPVRGGEPSPAVQGDGRVVNVAYANACGPIACYAALRCFGRPARLSAVAELCGWEPGRRTSLAKMNEALRASGMDCRAVRMPPAPLAELLRTGRSVAILAVRRGDGDIDHAVCAVDAKGEWIHVVDYPGLRRAYSFDELERRWDGAALIVSDAGAAGWTAAAAWLALGGALAYCVVWLFGRFVCKSRAARHLVKRVPMRAIEICRSSPLCAAAVVVGIASRGAELAAADSSARRTLSQTEDIGGIAVDSKITRRCQLKNDTRDPLIITGSRTSCGCLAIVSCPRRVEPGERGDVTLRLDTSGLHGSIQQEALFVVKDHPLADSLRIAVRGLVQGVWAEPERIDLGAIVRGKPENKRDGFFLLAAGLPDAKINTVRISDGNLPISTRLESASADAAAADKRIKALRHVSISWRNEPVALGKFRATIVVSTNSQERPTIEVPVTGHVVSDLPVRPAHVVFGLVETGGTVKRKCVVELGDAARGFDAARLAIATDHNDVACEAAYDKRSGRVALSFVFRPVQDRDAATTELVKGAAEGTYEGRTLFSIPYVAYVSPAGR